MSHSALKSRFCPSPTGLLHLGNVRTALFNALLAQGHNGTFLLRIEDTDKARSEDSYTQALMRDLRWLGMEWNEGPEHDRGAGPYWQSQRQAIYDQYYHQLESSGCAYLCFCTEQQLSLARKVQRASGKPPRYSGTCRNLTQQEIEAKLAQGLQPALRFKIDQERQTVFHDLVRGEQRFNNSDIGDFIIRRTDGTAPFMFCNAIDDALMGVTHALRGEDHLTNTPRQIMILEALGLPIPTYGHISLIIGSDGAPLSKRTGSRSVDELREHGFLPLAVVNYLARLGHHYADESFMSFEALSEKFSLDSLGGSPARYDFNQLLHWQHLAVQQLDLEALWKWLQETINLEIPPSHRDLFLKTVRPNIVFPSDAAHWAQLLFSDEFGYGEAQRHVIREAGKPYFSLALNIVDMQGPDFTILMDRLKADLGLKGKALFQPLRVAITNELHGPELHQLIDILGRDRLKKRLNQALEIA